jgi:predicted nuclease of restriction endonuclease-like RecB superfamily
MLPFNLARYKLRGEHIIPQFVNNSFEEIFAEVISLFRRGRKVGEILEDIKYLSKIYDHKLVKGISKLILRKCELDKESPVDPIIIRRKLFEGGAVLNDEERRLRVEKVSKELKIDPLRFMFSDLEEERVIINVPEISLNELIMEYNLELLETLLLRSYRLVAYLGKNAKEVLRRVKLLGLMYTAYDNPLRIEIYGPVTLMKLTEKYGRNLALIIPFIISDSNWRIEAEIVLGKKVKRIYKLEVENFPLLPKRQVDEKLFDSSIEERFYRDFVNIIKDWKIIREPEPLVISGSLIFPDFSVEKGNLKVYIEIMGFWTKEYVQKKLNKLKKLDKPCLVLVNEELGYGNYEDLNVIFFKRRIDITKVYKWLKDYEKKFLNSNNIELKLKDKVVSFKELLELGLSEDKIRNANIEGYRKLRSHFIREDLYKELSNINFSGYKLSELTEKYGSWIVDLLENLGYKIVWRGINDAVVMK